MATPLATIPAFKPIARWPMNGEDRRRMHPGARHQPRQRGPFPPVARHHAQMPGRNPFRRSKFQLREKNARCRLRAALGCERTGVPAAVHGLLLMRIGSLRRVAQALPIIPRFPPPTTAFSKHEPAPPCKRRGGAQGFSLVASMRPMASPGSRASNEPSAGICGSTCPSMNTASAFLPWRKCAVFSPALT